MAYRPRDVYAVHAEVTCQVACWETWQSSIECVICSRMHACLLDLWLVADRWVCPPAAGLSLLNISLDTLRPERFEAMTRRRGLHRVLDTLQQAVGLGYDPVKVGGVLLQSPPCLGRQLPSGSIGH